MKKKSTKSTNSPKMEKIYVPKGKAREFSPLAANLYSSCTHGCTYCYVPQPPWIDRKKFHEAVLPVKGALKKFEADAKEMAANKDDREVLFSFTSDPYPKIEAEQNITRKAIKILKKNKLKFSILTKAGKRAEKDFDLLQGYAKASFGTTLVFTSPKDADIWEPNAASIQERINTIKKAKELRIKTWVSIEPVIDPEQALQLIEQLHESVDHWKVGKINYNKEIEDKVDWLKFREDVRNLLKSKVPDKVEHQDYFYLKRSLTAKDKIEVIPGKHSNILLVAPHGVYGDDDNTGELAKRIANKIGCWAVINEYFQKPINVPSLPDKFVDLNKIEQIESQIEQAEDAQKLIPPKKNKKGEIQEVEKPKELLELQKYIDTIKDYKEKIVKTHGHAFIVWLHGIKDKNIDEHFLDKKMPNVVRKVDILVGYGQGKTPRFTTDKQLTDKLYSILKSAPINIVTGEAKSNSDYCGNNPDNLNQLFGPKNSGNNVESLQLEIKYTGFRDYKSLDKTAEALALGLSKVLEPKPIEGLHKIEVAHIKCKTAEDKKYIFRESDFKDEKLKKQYEADIKGLADSIRKEGLLQPIVVMRQSKKKCILLCGYQRYQAIKSLGRTTIDARVYDEKELSEQQRLKISMTENGERKDLNKVDIADSLQLIKEQTGLNDNEIGEEYSKLLGIGNSGKTINKYLQLANIKKSSPKIIEAVRKKEISFGVATDILATIGDSTERNLFFEKIVLPFRFPRPSLQAAKKYLEDIGPGLTKALTQKPVKDAISESLKAPTPWNALLTKLGTTAKDPEIEKQATLAESVSTFKKKFFDDDKLQNSLSVSDTSSDDNHKEITLQIKLTAENYADILKEFEKLAEEGENIKAILDKI